MQSCKFAIDFSVESYLFLNLSLSLIFQSQHFRTHSSIFEQIDDSKSTKNIAGKMVAISREARSNQRRLLTAFGGTSDSDLLKFNVLKVKMSPCFRDFSFRIAILLDSVYLKCLVS